jgi:hypothetical protein
MRNMSFALTTSQIIARTKTVTRRIGWWDLKPGQLIGAIEKGQGLKKGERVRRLGVLRVVSTRVERLNEMPVADLAREGFPELTVPGFVDMFQRSHSGATSPGVQVNRIEFEYVDGAST